jgi:hypothetical protein
LFRSSHGMRIYLDKQDMLFSGKILKLERRWYKNAISISNKNKNNTEKLQETAFIGIISWNENIFGHRVH